jgi:hypothetical protein
MVKSAERAKGFEPSTPTLARSCTCGITGVDTQPFWRLSDREAAFAFMAYCAKNGIPYRKDETLLGIGGLQGRGVGSRRGSKLTGIRQGKLRRRIRILTQNQ